MRAKKFYDKEGIGYELFIDYEKQSVMMIVDEYEAARLVEFDDGDLDDLIISLVDLKNELIAIRNMGNN